MNLLINALKGQANSMNLILLMAILSYAFYRFNRKKAGRIFLILALFFFVLFSTNYLPGYIVKRMESQYDAFDPARYPFAGETIYIHMLGGGYTMDERLPAHAQLSRASLGRLSEAIRIFHLYDSSILVVSGNVASGDESLASVLRKAAITLGVNPNRIKMLEEPSTTEQEAEAFLKKFGPSAPFVLVTAAFHMPRAMRFFRRQGLNPYPAPANYYIKVDDNPFALRWVPAAQNFLLMDRAIRESLGRIKGAF